MYTYSVNITYYYYIYTSSHCLLFDALDSLGKFILGSELWEEHFDSLLHHYVVNIWEAWKIKLYDPSLSLQPGIWGDLLGLRGRVVRICVRDVSLTLVSFTHLMLV